VPTRPRRPRGEGSIYQDRSGAHAGRWRAQLRLPDGTRRFFYGASRQQVAAKLEEARAQTRRGLPIPPVQLTLDKHLDDWLAATRNDVRPRTWASYDDNCRRYLRPLLGARRLADLRPADVRAFHRALRERSLSERTVEFADRVLRMALDQAVADDLIPRNVAKLAKKKAPSGRRPEVHPFDPSEALRFVEACVASAWRRSTSSPWAWACGAARRSACAGATSTGTTAP
jgi:integrase